MLDHLCSTTKPWKEAPERGWPRRASGSDVEERVEDAGVPDVGLRRLDLPLGNVLVPRLEEADHERPCEVVQVAATVMSVTPIERPSSDQFKT